LRYDGAAVSGGQKMRAMLSLSLLLCSAVAGAQSAPSPIPGAVSPLATIADIAWMAGQREGEGLGGLSIETISPPVAGQMAGHFQQIEDGKLRFYELYQFVEARGSLLLRIRHFGTDLKSWGQNDGIEEFPLRRLDKDGAYFEGLSMRRVGADGLETIVLIKHKDGRREDAMFRFRRKPL